jgi:hypothetical protein
MPKTSYIAEQEQGKISRSLSEIEQAVIQPLPRSEKLQLIADITRMLQKEDDELQHLREIILPEGDIPFYSPYNEDIAAQQMMEYLQDH